MTRHDPKRSANRGTLGSVSVSGEVSEERQAGLVFVVDGATLCWLATIEQVQI